LRLEEQITKNSKLPNKTKPQICFCVYNFQKLLCETFSMVRD
jgi:hypothetical protein